MHYDNMISCGEYPFFFDVETLVTGRMDSDMILPKSINNSILSTNVLPISVDSVALDINMSALFTGRHQSKRVVQYNWNDVFEIIVNCWCSSITVLFGST